MSCDSFDLDSISQLSLADSASNSVADLYKSASRAEAGLQPLPGLKSVSTDNIPNLELSYHGPRSGFPHSFVRSKLSVLPEEQATLTRRRVRCVFPSHWSILFILASDWSLMSLSSGTRG